jgi:DNA uptake protein ComE-like DNA-binding protein
VLVTSHGKRSITGVEVGIDLNSATEKQFQAIPGVGEKSAWKLVSARAKEMRDGGRFSSVEEAFELAGVEIPELAAAVLEVRA